jgi:hypothetical protein
MHNINNIETIGWQLYPVRVVRLAAIVSCCVVVDE